MMILVEKISDNHELIGRSYNFAPEIDGNVILSVKEKIDLENYHFLFFKWSGICNIKRIFKKK